MLPIKRKRNGQHALSFTLFQDLPCEQVAYVIAKMVKGPSDDVETPLDARSTAHEVARNPTRLHHATHNEATSRVEGAACEIGLKTSGKERAGPTGP